MFIFFFVFGYWNIQMKQILTVISFRLVRTFIALLLLILLLNFHYLQNCLSVNSKSQSAWERESVQILVWECEVYKSASTWLWLFNVGLLWFSRNKKKKLKSPLTCNLNCLRILHFTTTKTKTKNNSRKEVWPPSTFGCRIPLPAIDSARG